MRDLLSHVLCTLNPFAQSPDKYPVISVGNGRRAIRFLTSSPNAKGIVEVETLPDLLDSNQPIRMRLAPSKTPIVGWVNNQPKGYTLVEVLIVIGALIAIGACIVCLVVLAHFVLRFW